MANISKCSTRMPSFIKSDACYLSDLNSFRCYEPRILSKQRITYNVCNNESTLIDPNTNAFTCTGLHLSIPNNTKVLGTSPSSRTVLTQCVNSNATILPEATRLRFNAMTVEQNSSIISYIRESLFFISGRKIDSFT